MLTRVIQALGRIWRARLLTFLVLGLYVAWAARGFVFGARELVLTDLTTPTRLHLVAKQDCWASFTGQALLASVRAEHKRAVFVGDTDLSIACRRHTSAVARFPLEITSTESNSELRVVDITSNRDRYLRDLRAWRLEVDFPLASPQTTLHFEPGRWRTQYRVASLEILPGGPGTEFKVTRHWKPLLEVGPLQLSLGSGWYKRTRPPTMSEAVAEARPLGEHEFLYMRRHAFVRIETKVTEACWFAFPFKRLLPDCPPPRILIDREAIDSPKVTPYGEGRSVERLAFGAWLRPESILEVHCDYPGDLRSPRELGLSGDGRRIGYGVPFRHLEWVKTK